MGIFTRRLPPPTKRESVIRSDNGFFRLDDEYAELGEREGWLRYKGYFKLNGKWYSVFEHTANNVE